MFLSSCVAVPVSQAETEIQKILDIKYNKRFRICLITKNYSTDLFHEQTGFKVWLTDSTGIKFGPIFFEKNKHLYEWITYMGSDIEKEYQAARK